MPNAWSWYTDSWLAIERNYRDAILMTALLVATSGHSTLKANLSLARKIYWQIQDGQEIQGCMAMHKRACHEVIQHGKFHGRKYQAFYDALLGDTDSVVVDMWLSRWYFGYAHRDTVSEKEYLAIEREVKRLAKIFHACPRDMQAYIWCTMRRTTESYATLLQQYTFQWDWQP